MTRSIATVHTSAKARLTIIRISDPDRHQNLIICSLAHCQPSLEISCKSIRIFLRKVTKKKANNDENTTFLTEVVIFGISISLLDFVVNDNYGYN